MLHHMKLYNIRCFICVTIPCYIIAEHVFLQKYVQLVFSSKLRYFNSDPSFKLRCCRARDLFGSPIPVTTRGFQWFGLVS